MEQIGELPLALTPEQAQIEEIAGYLEEAGYAASREPVSYTHLDVYKRQALMGVSAMGAAALGGAAYVGKRKKDNHTAK